MLDRAEIAVRLLLEFEHQRAGKNAVGIHEVEELLEHHRVIERGGTEIAEQPDVAALQQQTAHHLHAAEHRKIVDLRHQADAFGDIDKIDGRNDVAGIGAQARHRLVVPHLALRQSHDGLQVQVDTVVGGRLRKQVRETLSRQSAEPLDERVFLAKRGSAFGRASGLGRRRAGSQTPGQRAVLLQHSGMAGDGFGDLLHQPAKLADFGGERIGGAARTIDRRRDLELDRIQATRDLGDLARKVGGAARQIADLVAEIAAIAQTVADAVEERHGGQRCERHNRRGAGVDLEPEIKHRANRGGDQHHADRDENGTDATHAVYPGPGPATGATQFPAADSRRSRLMFMTARLRATRSPAMVARIRPLFARTYRPRPCRPSGPLSRCRRLTMLPF